VVYSAAFGALNNTRQQTSTATPFFESQGVQDEAPLPIPAHTTHPVPVFPLQALLDKMEAKSFQDAIQDNIESDSAETQALFERDHDLMHAVPGLEVLETDIQSEISRGQARPYNANVDAASRQSDSGSSDVTRRRFVTPRFSVFFLEE